MQHTPTSHERQSDLGDLSPCRPQAFLQPVPMDKALVLIGCLLLFVRCDDERTRVLNGIPLPERNTGYDAVQYYAAIGTRHGIPKYKPVASANKALLPWYLLLLNSKRVEGLFFCSGSLMTPRIVQTACHCVAAFQKAAAGHFRLPRINHHWEHLRVVYVGVNYRFDHKNSMENVSPLESERFFIHRDCAKYAEGNHPIKYDFGWIRVKNDWVSGSTGVPIRDVGFTPLYSAEQLKQMVQRTTHLRLVCLRVGFGHYKYSGTVRELSGVLRHGWGVIGNALDCYKVITQGITYKQVLLHATWICAHPFPKHNQSAGSGDSGGPITCDNHNVALVSGTITLTILKRKTRKEKSIVLKPTGVYDPLYFSPYENAIEFRKDFEEYIANFEGGDTYVDIIRKKLEEIRKTTIRPRHVARMVSFSTGSRIFPSVLLATWIVSPAQFSSFS